MNSNKIDSFVISVFQTKDVFVEDIAMQQNIAVIPVEALIDMITSLF